MRKLFRKWVFKLYGGREAFLKDSFTDDEKVTIMWALRADENFYYTRLDRSPSPYEMNGINLKNVFYTNLYR